MPVNCPLKSINNTKCSVMSGLLSPKTKFIFKERFFPFQGNQLIYCMQVFQGIY